tara:strand:- start:96 stop:572 length:477 start_codon:yes stop_codon:yes gene_type:complete
MKVIDNFLSDNVADQIENSIIQDNFPWYYTGKGVYNFNVYFFSHSLLDEGKKSDYADEILLPLVSKLDGEKLLRAKINCYTKTENYTHYPYHLDNDDDKDIKVAIYYVNTNNGYTEVKDKGKVESVKNRLLLMNGDEQHKCTNQTDTDLRVNININYK